MRHRTTILAIAFFTLLAVGACHDNAWDELPTAVQKFISQYFAEGEVSSYRTLDNGDSVAQMRNGATLTFNSDLLWIDVNGNGSVLPGNFLFNELPEALYDYLSEAEQLSGVYRVDRNSKEYHVWLADTSVTYTIATGTVTYPSYNPSE